LQIINIRKGRGWRELGKERGKGGKKGGHSLIFTCIDATATPPPKYGGDCPDRIDAYDDDDTIRYEVICTVHWKTDTP